MSAVLNVTITITIAVLTIQSPLEEHSHSMMLKHHQPDIYYLHSVNLTNGTLVFLGRGEGDSGAQVTQQDGQLSR